MPTNIFLQVGLTLAGNLLIAGFVYWLVQRHQTNISRLTYLRQLEEDMMVLLNELSAVKSKFDCDKNDWVDPELFRFRNVLNEDPWIDDVPNDKITDLHLFVKGDNWVHIRRGAHEARVSSKSLQSLMLWFSRLARGFDEGVVRRTDLLTMWRQILSVTLSRRYVFFENYCGKYDWEIAKRICKLTFHEFKNAGRRFPVNAREATDEEFLRDVCCRREDL
jgi:hypothetical protein